MNEASVLKRKLVPRLAKALVDCTVETLLRKTMPRDADRLCGLDLVVDDVAFIDTDAGDLISALAETELVYRMTNEKGANGLCIVSPELLAGLIESQLYGYVTSAEAPERKPTRTDGIVVAALVDAWISSALSVSAHEGMAAMPFAGYTRQDGVLDQRNAGLLIEPSRYSKMVVKLTLGDNAKSGTLCLAWPERAQQGLTGEHLSNRMARHLSKLNAPMRVVLARLPLSMDRVRGLKKDDIIDVPLAALVSVKLEGVDGTPIATGRLGQANGLRAVRLNSENGRATLTALAAPDVTTPGKPPDMADLTTLPSVATMPDIHDLPDIPPIGGGLPGLPDLPDMGELPDLSKIGALPDLPELPDFP